jgi:hypothetical protein
MRWWHLVVHQRVRRGLLMRHHAWVPCCSKRGKARSSWVLVCLLRILAMLLLFHLLVLAFCKQLLSLLFQL